MLEQQMKKILRYKKAKRSALSHQMAGEHLRKSPLCASRGGRGVTEEGESTKGARERAESVLG